MQMPTILDPVTVKETLQEVIESFLIVPEQSQEKQVKVIQIQMVITRMDGTRATNGKEMWLE